MLPWDQIDWLGLWTHFFRPLLILLAMFGFLVAVVTVARLLSPASRARDRARAELMVQYGWDGKRR